MRSRSVLVLLTVAVMLVAGGAIAVKASADSTRKQQLESIFKELEFEGCRPEKVLVKRETLQIAVRSYSGDVLGAEDVRSLRAVRDQARLIIRNPAFKQVTAIESIIVNESGKVLYDATLCDYASIPEEQKTAVRIRDAEPSFSEQESADAIKQALKELPLALKTTGANKLGGYNTELSLYISENDDVQLINSVIDECRQAFHSLNEKGYSFGGFNITVWENDVIDPVLYLSADLIYDDYLWWQSPLLGDEIWTGHLPKSE